MIIHPYAEIASTVANFSLPLLLAMVGSMWLGFLFGWLYSPGPNKNEPAMRGQLSALRAQLNYTEDRLTAATRLLDQRQMERELKEADRAKASTAEVDALQKQVTALKAALLTAKRPSPETLVVQDPALLARLGELETQVQRNAELEKEIAELRGQAPKRENRMRPAPLPKQVYTVMSGSFGKRIEPDDLQLVEGIGPKIQEHLKKSGLKTWADVAAAKPAELRKVLAEGGERFHMHDPSNWPAQAKLMAENRWDELRKYQNKLAKSKQKA